MSVITYDFLKPRSVIRCSKPGMDRLRKGMGDILYSQQNQTPFHMALPFGMAGALVGAGALGMNVEQRLAVQGNAAAQTFDVPGLRATLQTVIKPYVHLRDRKAPPWPINWWEE